MNNNNKRTTSTNDACEHSSSENEPIGTRAHKHMSSKKKSNSKAKKSKKKEKPTKQEPKTPHSDSEEDNASGIVLDDRNVEVQIKST